MLITTPTPLSGIATTHRGVDRRRGLRRRRRDGPTWESDQGAGDSLAVTPTFSIPNVALVPGDNRITVSATDAAGNTGTDVLVVTYNTNGLEFEGVPVASPEALISGDSTNVSVRQKILANLDLDPATIEIVHLNDDGTTTSLTGLKDDGNRQLGDDLPGDDVYSGLMGVESPADSTGEEHFRVGARTKSAPDVVAWSPVLTIPRVAEVKADAIEAAITLADNAKILFTSLRDDGMDDDSVLAEVVLLARASGALATGPSTGKLGAWWATKDGLLVATDSEEILAHCRERGMDAELTSPDHVSGTDRIREIAARFPADVYANIQGDEPMVTAAHVDALLAPFFSDAEPLQVDGMLRGLTCPQYDVETLVGKDAGADRFKNLEEYGLILIASHGDTLFEGIGDALRPEWNWKSSGGQTVVLTGTILDSITVRRWQRDLRLGRMAIFPGGVTGVLPTFFTQYSVRLPASIVYVGSCRSAANASLSSALLERGAGAYLGYDGYVESAFAGDMATSLFTNLLAGQPLSQAFTPGQQDAQDPRRRSRSPATTR